MIGEEVVQFESKIHPSGTRSRFYVTSNKDREWEINVTWTVERGPQLVQDICLSRKNDSHFRSHSYASLEVEQITPPSSSFLQIGIQKLIRTASHEARFEVTLDEYRHSTVFYLDSSSRRDTVAQTVYRFTVVVSPILELHEVREPFHRGKTRKKTKFRFIKGLKEMSLNVQKLLVGYELEPLGDTLLSDRLSDVVLRCGRLRLKANLCVLVARSSRFRELYRELLNWSFGPQNPNLHQGVQAPPRLFNGTLRIVLRDRHHATISDDSDLTFHLALTGQELNIEGFESSSILDYIPEIVMNDVDESVFSAFMEFITDGQYHVQGCPGDRGEAEPFERIIRNLVEAAETYSIEGLREKCILSMENLLRASSHARFRVLEFASDMGDRSLINKVLSMFLDEDADVYIDHHQQEWQHLVNHDYRLAEQVLDSCRLRDKTDSRYFDSIRIARGLVSSIIFIFVFALVLLRLNRIFYFLIILSTLLQYLTNRFARGL